MRQHWIDPADTLAITRQCELAGVSRSFYGSRRLRVILARQGHVVNRKRVQRLMRILGLAGM
jgi:putative transposase